MIYRYLFAEPQDGLLLVYLIVLVALAGLVGLVAWVVARRSSLRAYRQRALTLRSIMFWLAIPGGLYLLTRYQHVQFFNLRVFLWLILAVFFGRLIFWLLRLQRLSVDAVDERQARRQRRYFQPPRRRRGGKRSRRR